MSRAKQFPFDSARRVTTKEAATARRAIERKLGKKRPARRGRPPKGGEKYLPVSIRLNPKIVAWAKKEAQRRGIGYQTVINEVLLAACA
jgi:uncharacterized protein (DUF4415 family)